jgi:hypothetical protein
LQVCQVKIALDLNVVVLNGTAFVDLFDDVGGFDPGLCYGGGGRSYQEKKSGKELFHEFYSLLSGYLRNSKKLQVFSKDAKRALKVASKNGVLATGVSFRRHQFPEILTSD